MIGHLWVCTPTVDLPHLTHQKDPSLIYSNLNLNIQQEIAIWCLPLSPFPSSKHSIRSSAAWSSDLNSLNLRKNRWLYLDSLNLNPSLQVKHFLLHFIPEESKRWHRHDHDCHRFYSSGKFPNPRQNFHSLFN